MRFNGFMGEDVDKAREEEPTRNLDLELEVGLPKRIHLLGIGGAGVSGAARILAARGHEISGHDRAESELLRALVATEDLSFTVGESLAEELPEDAGLVARSAAVPDDDPQVVRALERGLPVIKYAELLGRLAPGGTGLGVSGTHGKTTTSWMLWHALDALAEAGFGRLGKQQPGALVGGLNASLPGGPQGANAVPGDARGWFVMEACEYDRSFLELAPFGAIVTNLEADHLDYYGDLAAIEEAFGAYLALVDASGLVVLGADVPAEVEAHSRARVWRLGRELEVTDEGPVDGRRRFVLSGPGWVTPPVHLAVPGDYNVENAALALGLAVGLATHHAEPDTLEAIAAAAAKGVMQFHGAGRRFESWGGAGVASDPVTGEACRAVEVVHDYAHHPTELDALLGAAREAFPGRRLHLLFQPHQQSRTARLLLDFADVLAPTADEGDTRDAHADTLVVAPVYGARRHIDGAFAAGAPELAAAVRERGGDAQSADDLPGAIARLVAGLQGRTPAVALVVGAGDIEDVRAELLEALTAAFGAGHASAGRSNETNETTETTTVQP